MRATRRAAIWASVIVALLVCVAEVGKAQELNRAGLIVDFSNGTIIASCVEFTEFEITSAEMLRRDGLHVVTRSTPGIGEDVCKIADVGCDNPGDCFCEGEDSSGNYWSHWYWDAGEWQYAGMGDGSSMVSDGAIEGWVWGDESTQPPAIDYDQLCVPLADDPYPPPPPPAETLAPYNPYPEEEATEAPSATPPPTITPWFTDTPQVTDTPWPTETLWPTDTLTPTATDPSSLGQVMTTPTFDDGDVTPTNTATATRDVAATEAWPRGTPPATPEATREGPAGAETLGTPTLDRVAAILSTQVAQTQATPQSDPSGSGRGRLYWALVPVAVVLLALAGYVILLRRQRARARSQGSE